ncbi:MAG: flagellar basal body P-ring protein FlgI [Alphaproteobacteria bacterium]|nr:MAG: flagellar basal body P-ring protein FlgI [Alphaproteobacteria bacterium]
MMYFSIRSLLLALGAVCLFAQQSFAGVRIKDIADFEGVRENQLIGYGLVVGLNGTGDKLNSSPFTREAIAGMLERLGVGNLDGSSLKTKNTAAVMVTASLPPFARRGATIDVSVASLGDATSLRGGTLLVTPLAGADGEVYAVAQGPIATSGYLAQGNASSVVEGVPTSARIEGGAIIEREVPFEFKQLRSFRIALRDADFTTAVRVRDAVVSVLGDGAAEVLDSGTVEVNVTKAGGRSLPELVASVENLVVEPDAAAKVVMDDKSGTIVIGSNVRIGQVAISQGGLTVRIQERYSVSQPEPISIGGTTVVIPDTEVDVKEVESKFTILEEGVSLQDLVDGLNAIGVGARQTISILQAIKAAGALHAKLEII